SMKLAPASAAGASTAGASRPAWAGGTTARGSEAGATGVTGFDGAGAVACVVPGSGAGAGFGAPPWQADRARAIEARRITRPNAWLGASIARTYDHISAEATAPSYILSSSAAYFRSTTLRLTLRLGVSSPSSTLRSRGST